VIDLESSVVAVVPSAEGHRTGSMMATSGSFGKTVPKGVSAGEAIQGKVSPPDFGSRVGRSIPIPAKQKPSGGAPEGF
jgi:hypothetical protein